MGHTCPMLHNLALGRGELDRMAERRGDAAWFALACADTSNFIVGVDGGNIAVDGASLRNLAGQPVDPARAALLGRINGQVFIASMREDLEAARSLREVGAVLSDDESAVATAAVALHQWHRSHTHCPRCGAPTVNALAGWERHCTVDGTAHYPRTDPAVIVVITDAADRLLLARQQVWPELRFSLVAGYVEPGETAEHAVAREVLEEVGITVAQPEFLGSQPWPFPASLMLCYQVAAMNSDIQVDGVEIAEAMWLTRDELRINVANGSLLLPSQVSIARRGIEHWFGTRIED
jgi:NAD+ diphosphatase